MNALRPELKELPLRMMDLRLDERGFPVPWFVEWIDGRPDFRVMSGEKWTRAVKEKLCWVCGQKLGSFLVFVLGPMCGINRTTSEPPCHLECARWSAANCPFLSRPRMVRREAGLPEGAEETIGGVPLKRNPGVALLWVTRRYEVWRPDDGGLLIEVGLPVQVEWYAEGRIATRAEVEESIRTGLPHLEEIARKQVGGEKALRCKVKEFERLLPAA
jgi:hypothetical protein